MEITRKKREVPCKRLAETMQKTYEWEEEETNNNNNNKKARGQAAEAGKQATYLPGERGGG